MSSPHSPDEEYYGARDNLNEVATIIPSFSEPDDLESIPTVSNFRQHVWKGSQHTGAHNVHNKSDNICKKIFSPDKQQYIKQSSENGKIVFSGKVSYDRLNIKLHASGNLLTLSQDDFVARITARKQLDFSRNFTDVKRELIDALVITEVFKDNLFERRNEIYSNFKKLLLDRSKRTADDLECAEDLLQYSIALDKYKHDDIAIFTELTKSKYTSIVLKEVSQNLLKIEKTLNERNKNFPKYHGSAHPKFNLSGELQAIRKEFLECHKNSLWDKCSSLYGSKLTQLMLSNINGLPPKQALILSNKDISLFSDLDNTLDERIFSDFLSNLQESLFRKASEVRKYNSLRDVTPLTHPIYFHLCKSLQELILEISSMTDTPVGKLFKNKNGQWCLKKSIKWTNESPLNQSLEQQYRFIFTLMKHFEPGNFCSKKNFKYECKMLNKFSEKSVWQLVKGWFVSGNKSSILDYRAIFISILDSAIAGIFSNEELELFEPLLTGYIRFVNETTTDQYESFRIVAHNIVRFIVHTKPYLAKEISSVDKNALTKQIESIKRIFSNGQSGEFRDLVHTYTEYWKNRGSIVEKIPDKFPHGQFKSEMEIIRDELLRIADNALDKEVSAQPLVKFFRSFNEFLEDMNEVEFKWYVKGDDINTNQANVMAVNRDKNTYVILNPESFIGKHKGSTPIHYQIRVIQVLLSNIKSSLVKKEWTNKDTLDPEMQLNTADALLSAMRNSFLYLKEQPDYVSFETFEIESTVPFITVLDDSTSYEDFEKRIDIVGKSFWYLRKQDEIDIGKALELFRRENEDCSVDVLRSCYERYLRKFESYIGETSGKRHQDIIDFITQEVQKQAECIQIEKWDRKFKRETVPELLAGLAAVWSIEVSKDVAGSGKSLKPHCIQILCILRLLSADKYSGGVDKHLAQVLTGQGKSLVLGLVSSLLALTGHKVRTVCYSEYLAIRDQDDFHSFFRNFDVRDKVTYGTFDKLANEVLTLEVNGKRLGLRELIEDRVLNHSTGQTGQVKQSEVSNTILLIDEVDVFFSDQFYGNTYGAVNTITIPGLGSVQEKIWELANKDYGKGSILKEVEEFIQKRVHDRNQEFQDFNRFRYKPGKYKLLITEDNTICIKEYTNQSLYEEHLGKMIDCALRVAKGSDKYWYINSYKINEQGIISYRRSCGTYSTSTFCNYYNLFNYFRLKKNKFDSKCDNYAYLNVDCGKVSYATLPGKYPLILGVSGTLTGLYDHEKRAVRESYKILKYSVMPSFFGASHLKFDTIQDFQTKDSDDAWFEEIFRHASSKISTGQSVLVFFNTDVEINKFQERFLGKFDRLHILTENTEKCAKEKCINESGITKTVTLATRGQGRGVDFKSSVAVEKSGGVHVIQTFFSLDIKEETQIKGRTARKDNKGSYELILCKQRLIDEGFLKEGDEDVNYASLCEARKEKIKNKGSHCEEIIKKSEGNHRATMEFFESFFH